MKKNYFLLIGILIFIAIGTSFFFRKGKYQTESPHRGSIIEAIYGLGKVRTNNRYEVKIGVIGTVRKLYVKEGQSVRSGEPLIEIENISIFKTPMNGVVTLVQNYVGETVMPQIPILRVEDLKNRFIEVSLEQEGALRVRPNQKAKVIFESLRSQSMDGEVTALFPRNDEFIAHIAVNNLPENILPGMTADVSIEIGKIQNALLIPVSAINNGLVTVQKDKKAQKVKVEIGHVDGIWAEVKNGLHENDEIILPIKKVN